MAERVTKRDLNILLKEINNVADIYEGEYYLDYTMGKPRLVKRVGKSGERDISPRCSMKEMQTWMHAFIDGMEAREC